MNNAARPTIINIGSATTIKPDNAKTINVDTVENKIIITYRGSNKAVIDVASHPKVKELIDSYEEKERDSLKKYICFKVLEIILEPILIQCIMKIIKEMIIEY